MFMTLHEEALMPLAPLVCMTKPGRLVCLFPTYPDPLSLIHRVLQEPGSQPLRIIDLGAGTGIATRLLLQEAHKYGGIQSLLAVDPSPGMLSHLRTTLCDANDGWVARLTRQGIVPPKLRVEIKQGTFDCFDGGHDNDLVVIAQAWHWCPDFDRALSQIAQSLRPGGILALIWNLEDRDAATWVAQLRDLYEQFEDNTPQYRHMRWHAMYDAPSFARYFETLEPIHIRYTLPTDMSGVINRMLSKSYITVLDKDRQADLSAQAEALLTKPEMDRTMLDSAQQIWAYPYRTGMW